MFMRVKERKMAHEDMKRSESPEEGGMRWMGELLSEWMRSDFSGVA